MVDDNLRKKMSDMVYDVVCYNEATGHREVVESIETNLWMDAEQAHLFAESLANYRAVTDTETGHVYYSTAH